MMKDAVHDAIERTVNVNALIVPAGDELRNDPFKDLRSNLASRLIAKGGGELVKSSDSILIKTAQYN